MSTTSPLTVKVEKLLDQICNSNSFDLNEALKPFKDLELDELDSAHSEISSHFYERALARQRETERFIDIKKNLLGLSLESGNRRRAQTATAA